MTTTSKMPISGIISAPGNNHISLSTTGTLTLGSLSAIETH